ncbi:MAG: pyruvate dehydrogenase complex dihydrolipoamide acetyltransferase [Hyphomonadaceae bacterium]|nr:pyruvate dehydrogenase complex dihydrolipoamide acetyltransferase [Hyphomonadaceae bacterium]
MPINITMPALSPTMEEGTLAKWLVKPGDSVESGDVIAEIETDKATMEVEAVDEGTVAKILVEAGTEGVKVNAVIAVLAEEGEDADSVSAPSDATSPVNGGGSEPSAATKNGSPPPLAGEVARASGSEGGAASATLASTEIGDDRIKASPLARRIAAQKGVDLAPLAGKGSGPHGRIVKKDVEAAEAGTSAAPAADAPAPATQQSREVAVRQEGGLILPQTLDERVYPPETYDLVPLDGMRRTVARRLTESFMQVPHFPLQMDLQLDELLSFRKKINDNAPEGVKVSVNDMLIKASALALMDAPETNASYTDEGIAYHHHAHISVAVAVDGGLITPVIFHAEQKGLSTIAAEMKDLAARARERKLKPQEYMGGTFSISNLGMFGIKSFGSILNPPEGMILSVGAGEKRPVVGADGELTVGTVMSVTLTCDHRVIGGAEGAQFLSAFKRYVQTPEAMLL